MSFYRTFVESLSGYDQIKNSYINNSVTDNYEFERLYMMRDSDHRSLGQVVVLPEGKSNCHTDFLTSQELHGKALASMNDLNELANS
ncbi:hypothetical protein CYQ88_11300 [Hydrogenovibrio sp. SC-1]|uniref:hypothetical protein n=1 Tax=Hydrogenovibrio sp. SC-1 TaxID=2065820 RepID=UPI000C7A2B33|nr:hypothetical protein [Hydrogenovibrio sp. SC-1]PLA73425.1 hypothetical protein CYQ88_11300 [Hydrogenovibrio sp. SC-1]